MINVKIAEQKMAELAKCLDTKIIKEKLKDDSLPMSVVTALLDELETRLPVKEFVAFCDSI